MLQKAFGVLLAVVLVAVAGAAGGLIYGLVIDPVRYTNVDPQDLSLQYQGDYLFLIAADYAQTSDLSLAEERLQQLGFSVDYVANRAQNAIFQQHPLASALARLATDLGAGSPSLAALLLTPTATFPPRFTPTPTATSTPSPTATPTDTPLATATLTPTNTVPPTATAVPVTATVRPTQRPATATTVPVPQAPVIPTTPPVPTVPPVAFVVESTRMLSLQENQGCQGLHNAFVTVLDQAGNPLNGVTLALRWADGQDVLTTGHKPEFPGQVTFDLYGDYRIVVLSDVGGQSVQSQQSPSITSNTPSNGDLIRGGYCTDDNDCNARRDAVPQQLCYGNYSWAVTFRRTY